MRKLYAIAVPLAVLLVACTLLYRGSSGGTSGTFSAYQDPNSIARGARYRASAFQRGPGSAEAAQLAAASASQDFERSPASVSSAPVGEGARHLPSRLRVLET